ncbi:hypothetical protein L1987_23713 [Smallanthus sonchifolius]|uniref:Uncharacterized protein n=1 Tax=Smallanthus sonchifolius TaxID=185202 RepID=A0ACB9IIF2_9ASTR|nr:hypothetical protein L1987_23713 [Smallanthus sonchifolius]
MFIVLVSEHLLCFSLRFYAGLSKPNLYVEMNKRPCIIHVSCFMLLSGLAMNFSFLNLWHKIEGISSVSF